MHEPANVRALREVVRRKLRKLDRSAPCAIPSLADVCRAAVAAHDARLALGEHGESADFPETWVQDRLWRAAESARAYAVTLDPETGSRAEALYRNWERGVPEVHEADT